MTTLAERTEAEILDAAADRIERDGWHQGDFYPGYRAGSPGFADEYIRENNPPCCAYGALCAESPGAGAQVGAMHDWLEANYARVYSIVGWNDTTGRTKEEVVAALRAAAAEARKQS